jgi:hypothetical protein
MNVKLSTLAAAVTTALTMAAAGQASASVYAGSGLAVEDLTIGITGFSTLSITGFTYTLNNTASLNGVGTSTFDQTCGGLPSPGANTCGASFNQPVQNAPGSTVLRAENVFDYKGPGTNQYANADSVILSSQLTGAANTDTRQIAEAELQTGQTAGASSQISSTTGFNMTFTATGTGTLTLFFTADPDMRALINEPTAGVYSALSSMNASFTLLQTSGGTGSATWAPGGDTVTSNCTVGGGILCAENFDSQNLNTNRVTLNNNNVPQDNSWDPLGFIFTPFGITITGLTAGTWDLGLNAKTSVNLLRQPVPEPGVLALMGIGLLGLGMSARRRKLV